MILSLPTTVGILVSSGILLLSNSSTVFAQPNTSVNIFGIDSEPYGLTYGEWTAEWWKWMVSTPVQNNPIVDETGKNCGVGQSGSVWFLGGTTGGSAERTCVVPHGKAILFPVINSMCDYAGDPTITSESGLLACARADTDRATNMRAEIDGIDLGNLESYRVRSPLSNITYPENNIFGAASGATQMVSDGYWVFLNPLPAGTYQLSFGGETASTPTLGISAFATDTKYNLHVQ